LWRASSAFLLYGSGTQRLEEEIKKVLPRVPVTRMDRDTTTRKGSHQKILGQLRRGEVNLLVGTQMITKGHDLPRVTLVGVLAADLSLNLPDFRAGERTFQLLTQVAGRAGRGDLPGKVFIQSFNPNHYSIQMAQEQDYTAFFEREAQIRNEAPVIRSFQPDGIGESLESGLVVDDPTVVVAAVKRAEKRKAVIIRLFESTGRRRKVRITEAAWGLRERINLNAFEIRTLIWDPKRRVLKETDLMEGMGPKGKI